MPVMPKKKQGSVKKRDIASIAGMIYLLANKACNLFMEV